MATTLFGSGAIVVSHEKAFKWSRLTNPYTLTFNQRIAFFFAFFFFFLEGLMTSLNLWTAFLLLFCCLADKLT